MRLNRAFFIKGLIFTAAGLAVAASAAVGCSSESRPGAGASSGLIDGDGAIAEGGGSVDGSTDGDSEAAVAEIPKTCSNTIRDGAETDVDCGGAVCSKCIEGKTCINTTDCAGGACLNKVCKKPECSDKATDGDETDVDCGGTVCARCTTGKRCKVAGDCLSNTCVNDACACPKGMRVAGKAVGGAYCVDEVEVTKGQYDKFLTASYPAGDQIDVCKAINPSFPPRGGWPPALSPPVMQPNGLPFSLGLPVHYVNWCQAYTYCKWAGKQLCGKIDGGEQPPAEANNASTDAWFNACSAQSTRRWPYSTIFDADQCNGDGVGLPGPKTLQPPGQLFGYGGLNQDEGVYQVVDSDAVGNYTVITHAECHGGAVGLYHMSGNVAEWEDSCDGPGGGANCLLRGGSYGSNNDPESLACDAVRSAPRVPPKPTDGGVDPLADVGFRCCLY